MWSPLYRSYRCCCVFTKMFGIQILHLKVVCLRFWLKLLVFGRVYKMASPNPVIKSKQKVNEVNGILTQVVCTDFNNYIFVVLTQYGKIGTLVSITPDSRSNDISTPTCSTKVLLGKDEVGLRGKRCGIIVKINVLSLRWWLIFAHNV